MQTVLPDFGVTHFISFAMTCLGDIKARVGSPEEQRQEALTLLRYLTEQLGNPVKDQEISTNNPSHQGPEGQMTYKSVAEALSSKLGRNYPPQSVKFWVNRGVLVKVGPGMVSRASYLESEQDLLKKIAKRYEDLVALAVARGNTKSPSIRREQE